MGKGEGEKMQIEHLSPAQWEQITSSLTWLWILVACVILFNGCLLFGRAVLPSLVETRTVPASAERAVQIFVVFGGAAIVGVIYAAITFSDNVEVLYEVYERTWY
jgi:hypothetical protein